MKVIDIKTSFPYKVVIQNGAASDVGFYVKDIFKGNKICIVSDSNVSKLYSKMVFSSLKDLGCNVSLFEFDAGEQSKRLETVNSIYSFLFDRHFTRADLLIALGGGVTGDLTGFAASTYLRGIDYIQIPTSLLSQVDSSVGGKTGVNTDYGKNLIGSFFSPRLVIIDPLVLKTLDKKYFCDGMAEVIKYSCIRDRDLFLKIKNDSPMDFIEDLICKCLNIKKNIIEVDEFDKSERMILNFGHTIGHSIEKNYRYKKFSHGQAVSIGMSVITNISESVGLTKRGTYKELTSLLKKYNLPVTDEYSIDDICDNIKNDKKSDSDNLNLVILRDIGDSFIHTIKRDSFRDFLRSGKRI